MTHFTTNIRMVQRGRRRRKFPTPCNPKEFGVRCGRLVTFRNSKIFTEVAKNIQVMAKQQGESKPLEVCTLTFPIQQRGIRAELVLQGRWTGKAETVLLSFHGIYVRDQEVFVYMGKRKFKKIKTP